MTDNDTTQAISFSFGLDEARNPLRYILDEDDGVHAVSNSYKDIQYTVSIVKTNEGTRISGIKLSEASNGVTYDLVISDQSQVTSLLVDGVEMIEGVGDQVLFITPAKIFPTARFVPKIPATAPDPTIDRKWDSNPLRKAIGDLLSLRLDTRTTGSSLGRLVALLFNLTVISKETIKELGTKSGNRSWGKLTADIGGADREELYSKIRNYLLVDTLVRVLNSTASDLSNLLSSILYIGPARAKSDRYYRYQDLAVSEIDPGGQNFPMFLNSLSEARIKEFSDWVKTLFGYGVSVGRESGHITINLMTDTGTVNVVDTGYGVSQILPVLGQVWWANNKPRYDHNPFFQVDGGALILAIEQPELHLHPAHQALLADAFVSGLQLQRRKRSKRVETTHFILETHSETMINRLGALVAEERINASDIQILVFNSDKDDGAKTHVEQVTFNDEGHLINWPYDFFIPSV